jgi:probable HAF family extracellular repeat protein
MRQQHQQHHQTRTALLATVALGLVTSAAHAAPPSYIATDLGTLMGPYTWFDPGSVAVGLSRSAIVGHSVTDLPGRNVHAFRVVGTELTDLGVLPGDEHSMAFAASPQGDVIGVSYTFGELTVHGVLWPFGGGAISLGAIEPHDINANGAIAGSVPVAGAVGTTHAALLIRSTTTDLGTLGGPSSMGLAINASNWVVGDSMLADSRTTHGFVWRNGSMLDLGTLGGSGSRAADIDGQTVVGFADTAAARPHAVRWILNAAGGISSKVDLGVLPGATTSAATSVANLPTGETIVGTSDDRAVRWTAGAIVDLNTLIDPSSGWTLTRAIGIDSEGRIVGVGRHYGLTRGFVLTPRSTADFDADGSVGPADLAILLGGWGSKDPLLDLDGNGSIGPSDLAILLGQWS